MLSSHALRGRIPTPVLPGTLSSDRPRRGIRGRQRVRRPSPCLERGTRMEPWVAPRGVPTPIESLPAPQAACRSPIDALRQTGFARAYPGPSIRSQVALGLTFFSECRRHTSELNGVLILRGRSEEATKGHLASCRPKIFSFQSTNMRLHREPPHVRELILMSTAPRPIPGRPDETPRPGPAGPRTPYPVNDPGFAEPNKPGSEPDYIPPPSPGGTPEL
jgi:hypothetical protein